MHNYKLTKSEFDQIISMTRFKPKTIKAMEKILINGASYESTGLSKQFAHKKLITIKKIAESLKINM